MKKSFTRVQAENIVRPVIKRLKQFGKVEICGSYRRGKFIVNDIDIVGDNPKMILVLSKMGTPIMGGEKQTRVIRDGLQIDLIIAEKGAWGSSILFLTGSAKENVRLRAIAKGKGLKLNRNGLWDGESNVGKTLRKDLTEEQIYTLLGEKYKKPEERD